MNKNGESALHIANIKGNKSAFYEKFGHNPRHSTICVIFLGEKEVVRLLLRNGAEPIKKINNNEIEESLLNGSIARNGKQFTLQIFIKNP